jgi:cytochrome c peroxidase
LFDLGTGKRLDVPSLLHLWDTAPYLHDGRARTLHDVFTVHNPQDRHGKTSHLTAQQLDDLVAFLLAPYTESNP